MTQKALNIKKSWLVRLHDNLEILFNKIFLVCKLASYNDSEDNCSIYN